MAEEKKPKAPHTLADHLYGREVAHVHGDDADHYHDHAFDHEGPAEDNPLWQQDNDALTTVGIDIGSALTQATFSRVHLRRLAEDLTSRYYVVARETLFQSQVTLTPYQSEERIDDLKLGAIIDDAYVAAGLPPDKIDTGVVILTGEALRRENAQRIAAILVENGKVIATAAIHIGGRLQVVEQGRIVRLDPAGKHHAARAGFAWQHGDIVDTAELHRVAEAMADALVAAIRMRPLPSDIARLYLTDPIADLGRIDAVMFSGGVAEYIYQREDRDFGDLGRCLGNAIRVRIDGGALPWPVLPAGECIRATALGASEYSVQLSGNTSYISAPGKLLPRRNLQVLLPPFIAAERIDPDELASAIRNHIIAFDLDNTDRDIALALRWSGAPSHPRLLAFAEGIKRGLADRIAKGLPLHIMLDGDVAHTLGHLLRDECSIGSDLLVIDGVVLWDFDYIDLGRIRMPSYTVPVTIKSLVFSEDPRGPRPRQRLHHREHDHAHVHEHSHTHGYGHEHSHAHAHHKHRT